MKLNKKLTKEWDYDKNKLGPENYTPSSGKKVWWRCEKGHEWLAIISNRNKGSGCPYCCNRLVCDDNSLLTINPKICKEWNYNKNELGPDQFMPNSGKKVWWVCEKGHEWLTPIKIRNKGHGCPYCAGQKATKENNLLIINSELCKEWDYEKNKFGPENIMPSSSKLVYWKCNKNHVWKTSVGSRNRGHNCPYCSGRNATKEYNLLIINPKLCEEWDYNKNELDPENYTPSSGKKVWWICKNNHSWRAAISDRNVGKGCSKCSKIVSKSGKKWLDDLNIGKREKYIRINGKKYYVDGFEDNVVYEFLGDYWHGNPYLFNPNEINAHTKSCFGKLLYKTIKKFNNISNNFDIIYRWEQQSNNFKYKYIIADEIQILKTAEDFFYDQNRKTNNILEILS